MERTISQEAVKSIQDELMSNRNWIAYNTIPFWLEKSDVYCFKDKHQAQEFAADNISDYDSYAVIQATSITDALRKMGG
jgi:hypothetical protein